MIAIARWGALVGTALTLIGCVDDLPLEPEGGRITGHVVYAGDAHTSYRAPALEIAAFIQLGALAVPIGPPHSLVTVVDPDFGDPAGVAYELRGLPAYGYFVVAQLRDLEDERDVTAPAGGFPDICAVAGRDVGNARVTDDVPAIDIDFVLYDDGGAADPCRADQPPTDEPPTDEPPPEPDFCVPGDRAGLALRVNASDGITAMGAGDQLIVGLFDSWPAVGPPGAFRVLPGDEAQLPALVTFDDLMPGDFVVYACLDRGRDNLLGCDDPAEDSFSLHGDGVPVELPAGRVVSVELVLGSESNRPPLVSPPCE